MSATSPYIGELRQQIRNLIAEKNFKKAFKIFEVLAGKFPMNREIYKIKEEIDDAISHENDKKIRDIIDVVKPLWKEKKYAQIIKMLTPFYKAAPRHKKLLKTMKKAQDKYRTQVQKAQAEFKKSVSKNLKELIKGNVKNLMTELISLERQNPGNTFVRNLIKETKAEYIHEKLSKNYVLLKTEKFDVMERLIKRLKDVDRENPELIAYELELRQLKYSSQKTAINESLFEGLKNLDTLMKLKKYDKAVSAAKEIIRADKTNQKAHETLELARKGVSKQTRNKTVDLIIENLPTLKEEYKKNSKKYIKI